MAGRIYSEWIKHHHISTDILQRLVLGIGSGAISLVNPRRGDLVATFGELTAPIVLPQLLRRMESDSTGREILRLKPLITNQFLDVNRLASLPVGTLGHGYHQFLKRLDTSPDQRPPVKFVDDYQLAYVMTRYRQTHDLTHVLLNMKTDLLGEVCVKWFEGIQMGLPMAMLGGLFGAIRLYPKQRDKYTQDYLPWVIRNAQRSNLLLNLFWENEWECDLSELRSRLNIEEPLFFN